MKPADAKAMVSNAIGLFPNQLSAEMSTLLFERILAHDKITVQTALKNHRVNHEFFSFPQFMEGMQAEHKRSQGRREHYEHETVADWLMKQPDFRGMQSGEAVLKHFADSWWAVATCNAGEGDKQNVRKMILGHAFNALRELRWNVADAMESARGCVGLNPGEKIAARKGFRMFADVT